MTTDVLDALDVDQLPDDDDGGQGDAADAPYGYLKDGVTPRRKPGPATGAGKTIPPPRARARKATRTASRRGGASPAGRTPPAADPIDPVMVAGAQAILGVPTRALAMAGLAVGLASSQVPEDSPRRGQLGRLAIALSADASTLILHGESLSVGMASLATPIPWLAGVYQKAAQVGPYAAALEAGAAVVLQLLCNHGLVPVTAMLGTVDPVELVAQVMGS